MSNPFEDNPFADPSIQNVTQTTQQTQMTLADYNPFAQNNTTLPKQQNTAAAAVIPTAITKAPQPTAAPVIQAAPPVYTQTAAQNINIDSIRRQEEELARKAAELDRKEQALRNAEQGNARVHNFPPLPQWCPWKIKPCFYQDIAVEIPVDFQKWVRILYYLWIFHGCTLFFNVIGALVIWIASDAPVSFGFSLLYFFLFTPCSYICWFRPAYKAFRDDSSANFMIFFFVFFIQILVSILQFLGIKDTFCGFLTATRMSKEGDAPYGVVTVWVFTIIFGLITLLNIIVIVKIHRLYRGTSASFEQAQREFASNVLSNKNVQNAAATVITEGARQTVQNYNTNNTTPGRF